MYYCAHVLLLAVDVDMELFAGLSVCRGATYHLSFFLPLVIASWRAVGGVWFLCTTSRVFSLRQVAWRP